MLKKKGFLSFGIILFTLNIMVNVLLLILGADSYTFLQSLLVLLKVLVYGFLTWNVWIKLRHLKTEEILPKGTDTIFLLTILIQIVLILLT